MIFAGSIGRTELPRREPQRSDRWDPHPVVHAARGDRLALRSRPGDHRDPRKAVQSLCRHRAVTLPVMSLRPARSMTDRPAELLSVLIARLRRAGVDSCCDRTRAQCPAARPPGARVDRRRRRFNRRDRRGDWPPGPAAARTGARDLSRAELRQGRGFASGDRRDAWRLRHHPGCGPRVRPGRLRGLAGPDSRPPGRRGLRARDSRSAGCTAR